VCVCVGLLHAGDRVLEVNGFPVDGLEPEQVIQVVVRLFFCLSTKIIKEESREYY